MVRVVFSPYQRWSGHTAGSGRSTSGVSPRWAGGPTGLCIPALSVRQTSGVTEQAPLPWEKDWTEAALAADEGMKVVTGLMGFVSSETGNKHAQQLPLYLAAVTFSYAVWENYVEDLAYELTAALSATLEPSHLPMAARDAIESGASTWDLAVDPGWRGLWARKVRSLTKGTEGERSWGLNTASKLNVDELFQIVGIDPVPQRLVAPDPVGSANSKRIPDNIAIAGDGTVDVKNALSQLIAVRGEAVHTATTSSPLYKNQVLWWGNFVTALYEATDISAREQCAVLATSVDGSD